MKPTETLSFSPSSSLRNQSQPVRITSTPLTTPTEVSLPAKKDYFTIPETARFLQVSVTTIRNMIDCGSLDAVPVNPEIRQRQHKRITRESLERFQKERFNPAGIC